MEFHPLESAGELLTRLSLTLANLNGAQERALSRLKDGPGNFFTVTASPKP